MSSKLRKMLLITSNGYQDSDDEYVSVAALKQYADDFNTGRIGEQNLLDFYHSRVIGKIVEARVHKGFLFEVAEELPTKAARLRWNYIKATPFKKWGCSQFFRGWPIDGVFRHIYKTRSTVCQRKHAANMLTAAGIIIEGDF